MKTYKIISKYIFVTAILILLSATLNAQEPRKPRPPRDKEKNEYSIEQAISDEAQLHTVAFNGLAFITGTFGADCFFPPGKVADFFGFQYMRDIDKNEMGHNTNFLTSIASNVISILTENQLQQLKDLANIQASIYDTFAMRRIVIIKAFRDELEGNIPKGKHELSKEEVEKYCSKIYESDAELSYNRAVVVGKIISSFSDSQKAALAKLQFGNSSTWPDIPENLEKRSMSHRAHVCVMTYASELFSWYAGSVDADVYFCPERHGTYFGGFFMKDYPAMGNRNYKISTSLTGDKGEDFLNIISSEQADSLRQIISSQKSLLEQIVKIRTDISKELRKAMNNGTPDKTKVFSLINKYGELDGEMSYNYAMYFAKIKRSLTEKQMEQLIKIRNLDVVPNGTYLFSDPINMPEVENTDFLFK